MDGKGENGQRLTYYGEKKVMDKIVPMVMVLSHVFTGHVVLTPALSTILLSLQ